MEMGDMGLRTSKGGQGQQEYIPQKQGICFAVKQGWLLRLTLFSQADFSETLIQEFTRSNIFKKLWMVVVDTIRQAG